MKLARVYALFLAIYATTSGPWAAAAESARKQKEPPPQFHVTEKTRPMAFARTKLVVPMDSVVGSFTYSLLSCRPTIPVYGKNVFSSVSEKDYKEAFNTEARAAGYMLSSSATELFETRDAAQAEVLIGAVVKAITIKSCTSLDTEKYDPTREIKIDARITVEWQAFDPLERKLIFTTTVDGIAELKAPLRYAAAEAGRAAFQQAAKAVLADQNFAAALYDGKKQTAEEPADLFKEKQSAPQEQLPKIVRTRLSSIRFEDQSPAIRAQVVTIRSSRASGSGFYIADGLLLTNEHVVRGTPNLRIKFNDQREIEGQVVKSDVGRDIALVRTAPVGVTGLPLRLEYPPVGARVFVVGSPLDVALDDSVSAGIISAHRDFALNGPNSIHGKFIQSDVAVNHGNSGGPMFDEMGNVIGLTDIGLPGQDGRAVGVNLFIPIADGLDKLGITFAPTETAKTGRPGR